MATVISGDTGVSQVQDGVVSLNKLAANSVNSAKIVDGSVTNADLATPAVSSPIQAWVCFLHNGTTATIKASGGVSGVTCAASSATVTFSSAQADTSYGVLVSQSNPSGPAAFTYTRNTGTFAFSGASTLTGLEFMVQILR